MSDKMALNSALSQRLGTFPLKKSKLSSATTNTSRNTTTVSLPTHIAMVPNELWEKIIENLNKSNIKNVRLTTRVWTSIAAAYLLQLYFISRTD
jgi:hypothetical protein